MFIPTVLSQQLFSIDPRGLAAMILEHYLKKKKYSLVHYASDFSTDFHVCKMNLQIHVFCTVFEYCSVAGKGKHLNLGMFDLVFFAGEQMCDFWYSYSEVRTLL